MPSGETFGRYVLLKRLGSGAMGDVHLASSGRSDLPSPVVIKRLHGRLSSDPLAVRRFKHEAELAGYVSSPHVAKVFDAGIIDDTFFIAMEYIDGWALSRVIHELTRRVELPSIPAAVRMIEGAIEGLDALHRGLHPGTRAPLQIVHRDVAPKNIMVGTDGRSHLIDLGIGRSNAREWKTRTGLTVGTPGYMAPEQIFGDSVDHRADVYAAGVVLFELLTLNFYIDRGSIGEMLAASRVVRPRAPSTIRSDVPPALDAVVVKAVSLDPNDRFASAGEMLAMLRDAVPPGGDEAAVLINDLLWRELEHKRTEVDRLLVAPDTALLDTMNSGAISDPSPPSASRKRRRVPGWVIGSIAVGTVVGVTIGRLHQEEEVTAIPIVEVEEPPAPRASAVQRSEAAAPIEPPPTVKVIRKAPAKRAEPVAKVDPPPSPPPPLPIDPNALMARAMTLKRQLQGTDREKLADAILREITLGMGAAVAPDWSAIQERLLRLERD